MVSSSVLQSWAYLAVLAIAIPLNQEVAQQDRREISSGPIAAPSSWLKIRTEEGGREGGEDENPETYKLKMRTEEGPDRGEHGSGPGTPEPEKYKVKTRTEEGGREGGEEEPLETY